MLKTAPLRVSALLVAVVLGLACSAQTDRNLYLEAEAGSSEFSNRRPLPVWLGGCNTFVQERWTGGGWSNEGGEVVCFWEGFAQPVAANSSLKQAFTARDAGRWRLAYLVGLSCDPEQPLSPKHCSYLRTIYSNEFEVVQKTDDQQLCEETGGVWDPVSCGDYFCGQFPLCDAIIPGCDCGPLANFIEGEGCAPDPACAAPCGGFPGFTCPAGAVCYDRPGDHCGPVCAADCIGFCATPPDPRCGGFVGRSCPDGLRCIDDPSDTCSPDCGGADCGGICREVLPLQCGGFIGALCPAGYSCMDVPGDGCNRVCGGADCPGVCVRQGPSFCGGIAGIACPADLICVDDPSDRCDPDCGGASCGGFCVDPVGAP
jgi:hypothetical protein